MESNTGLESRLRALEHKVARTRAMLWAAIACLGISVALGYAHTAHRAVTVQKLRLKDHDGRVRATLTTNPDGRPLLMLQDNAERPGITLGYNEFQQPGVNVGLFGPRTRIGFGEQGLPLVTLQDDDGNAHIELALQPEGRGSLRVNGTEDPARWPGP